MKKYIGGVITILFLGAFGWYYATHRDLFEPVFDVPGIILLVFLIARTGIMFLNSVFLVLLLKAYGKTIGMFEGFAVTVLSTVGNFFTPFRGGAGIRAVYMKRKHNLAYTDFISTMYGTYLVVFFVNGLMSLVSLWMLPGGTTAERGLLYGVILGMLSAIVVFSLLRLPTSLSPSLFRYRFIKRVWRKIAEVQNGWRTVVGTFGVMFPLILIALGNIVLSLVVVRLEFISLNIDMSWMSSMLYVGLSGISLLLSITPGSIGIREAVYLVFSDVMGITNEEVLQVALLDRGVQFFFLLIMYILSRLLWTKREKDII